MSTIVPTGTHLIVDIQSDVDLTNLQAIQGCLESCAVACGATILHTVMHSFGPGSGVTGVVILAESHISIHTWPELRYAAVDIFMCGSCDPHQAISVLKDHFLSEDIKVRALDRCWPKREALDTMKHPREELLSG
jgi:S-adenosylmethionine decarboxylase